MQKEDIKELSPTAMRRKANLLDEDALELCRRAQQLRRNANNILRGRAKAKRSVKPKSK